LQAHIEGHGPRMVLDLDAVRWWRWRWRWCASSASVRQQASHSSIAPPLYASGLPGSNIGQDKVAWGFTIARVRQARRFG
jgi:hypothetical protein